MALRGRRINSFLESWCLVCSGGLDIWVSSTSFQKSDIGWPHHPPKEKLLKFNGIFMILSKKKIQNIKFVLKSYNSGTWMTLKSSEVISKTQETSAASLASPTSPALYPPRNSWWFDHPWHQNDQFHFCGMDHQKSFFLLILAPFLLEAVEASLCHFFENWLMKLKFPNLLKPLWIMIQ